LAVLHRISKAIKRNIRLRFFGDVPAFVILLESDQERCSHVRRDVLPKLPICDIINATHHAEGELDAFLRDEKIDIGSYTHIAPAHDLADLAGELGDREAGTEASRRRKLACSISHMRTWKAIVDQDLRHAIVLEDDVAVRDGFSLFIRKLKKQVPVNYDLVHLYVSGDRSEWLKHVANTKEAYVSYIPKWGRSAYLLSRSGAEKLLLGFQKIVRPGDVQIYQMAQTGKLSVYCATESYVDNLGQLHRQFNGEKFRSTLWPQTEEANSS
jgi:GR25 family glycosyltransferase involved in LPS biosynthesis